MKLLLTRVGNSELPGLWVHQSPTSRWSLKLSCSNYKILAVRCSLIAFRTVRKVPGWSEIIFFMEYEMNSPRDVISKFTLVIVISFCNWDHFTSLMFSENLNLIFFLFFEIFVYNTWIDLKPVETGFRLSFGFNGNWKQFKFREIFAKINVGLKTGLNRF